MPYVLHEDISYCEVDGGLVLLDVGRDRYFRLPHVLETALLAYLSGNVCSEENIEILVEQNVLKPVMSITRHDAAPAICDPERSNIERVQSGRATSIGRMLEVLAVVLHVRRQLKRSTLKYALNSMISYRLHKVSRATKDPRDQSTQRLFDAADEFRWARPYVPVEPVCLLDSLALTRFLAKRGLHADIVIGITSEPFSAHCWVQVGDIVLDDTVGHASGYTRMRVV